MYPSEIRTDDYLEDAKSIYDAHKEKENTGCHYAPEIILPRWEDLPESVQNYFVAASAALSGYLDPNNEPEDYDGLPEFTPAEKDSEAMEAR